MKQKIKNKRKRGTDTAGAVVPNEVIYGGFDRSSARLTFKGQLVKKKKHTHTQTHTVTIQM